MKNRLDFRNGGHKKIKVILLFIIVAYVVIRMLFSYTIICIPSVFGTRTYIGYNKYDFPICIINPMKINPIKKDIFNYLKDQAQETYQYGRIPSHYVKSFYDFRKTLLKYSDFEIVSVAISMEGTVVNRKVNSFLVQQKGNPEKKCIVIIDKTTKKILKLEF